ncbi:hypothetical protein [Saccharicrinis aurantiacus]|uniref:hypothetical protein n=1 Tax=Saccharicrinis aurantiacus TaxID=1849719 RepID=UPI0024911940|nr:hypothetical protein [Saccharicrinis aurantiacus]
MKNIYKIFVLLFVGYSISSCEPDAYEVPDIDLTPVYYLTETGNNTYKDLNIYKEKDLFIVWDKDGAVSVSNTQAYTDSSDTENYSVTFVVELDELDTINTIIDESTIEEVIAETSIVTDYHLTGLVAEDQGQLLIDETKTIIETKTTFITNEDGSITEDAEDPTTTEVETTTVVTGMLSNQEVYN